jgi:thiamine biosynthesis lipoprotein
MKTRIIAALFIVIFLNACQDVQYHKIEGETQGTTYHIIYNKDKMLKTEIDSILNDIDLSLSKYREDAILYKINKNQDVALDNHFIKVFNKAIEISKASNGLFDITVGPLVNLYGFGNENRGDVLDSNLIDSLLQFVGYKKVKIVNNHLEKENPGIQIDMNAIAQGYSVDVIADFLERQGVKNYMVEVGGEVICKGKNEFGDEWRIGVEKPLENTDINDRQIELILGFKDVKKAVATSGNYRKFFVENGIKFTHTINPQTGYPTRDSLVSASIMANDCMTADGYATACMVSGFENAKKIVENDPNLEAFFIYFDKNGNYKFYFTSGYKKYVIE